MSNLHELFDAATDGLPPLPDLAPSARRIVRRRRLAARTSAAVLAGALAIGAGTFALSAHNSGQAVNAATGAYHTFSRQYLLDTLQALWPDKGEHLAFADKTDPTIVILRGTKQVGEVYFAITGTDNLRQPVLSCGPPMRGSSCLDTTATDGDSVSYGDVIVGQPLGDGKNPPKINMADLGVEADRVRGAYDVRLQVKHDPMFTAQQMLKIVESPAYERLFESAIASHASPWPNTAIVVIPPGSATPTLVEPSLQTPSATPTGSASAPANSPTPSPANSTAPSPTGSASAPAGSPTPRPSGS